jgi:glyoxylase I family protein
MVEGGSMKQAEPSTASGAANSSGKDSFVLGLWGVRYQVKDVNRSVAFYTKELGFQIDQQHLPAFAQVSTARVCRREIAACE